MEVGLGPGDTVLNGDPASTKVIKIKRDYPNLWSQMYCHVLMNHSVYVHCVSKKPPVSYSCCSFVDRVLNVITFGTYITVKIYFIFGRHPCTASALLGETGNPEIASFYLSAACWFTKKTKHIYNFAWYSWTTLHGQNDRLESCSTLSSRLMFRKFVTVCDNKKGVCFLKHSVYVSLCSCVA